MPTARQNGGPPRALVTGTSSGIGRSTALLLDRAGWQVFAGVRSEEDAHALGTEGSERLQPVILDVTRHDTIEATLARIGGQGLSGLVNNAGIACPGAIEFLDLDELRRQLEVNVVGQVAVTRACLPLLRETQGRIVNVGSIGGFMANPFLGAYAASKFAMEAVTDALRRELRAWGIHVAIVEPGTIATRIWEKGDTYSQKHIRNLPDRAKRLYGAAMVAMTKSVDRRAANAIEPDVVAKAIQHALTARRPRTRYLVGIDAKLLRTLSLVLPDRVLDALVMRALGLHGAKGAP